MNRRITFYVGNSLQGDGRPIRDVDAVIKRQAAREYAARLFGGSSDSLVTGSWRTSSNKVDYEESWRVEIVTTDATADRLARTFAEYLRSLFNQESVLMTFESLDAVYNVTKEASAA